MRAILIISGRDADNLPTVFQQIIDIRFAHHFCYFFVFGIVRFFTSFLSQVYHMGNGGDNQGGREMIHEFLLIGGFACAVVGLTLSLWTLWDEIKKRRDKHENEE